MSPEENFKTLEKLPEELKDVLFSSEAADHIRIICEKFKVPAGKIPLVAETTGKVVSRIIPLEDFEKTLKKVVGLKKEVAENVAEEIDFRIFSNIREGLIATTPKPTPKKEGAPLEGLVPEVKEETEELKKTDAYREPVE